MAAERLLYRIPDVAELLGCSETAARRMIERGHIPARRLGRRIVVLPDELEQYLKSLPKTGPEPVPHTRAAGR